MLKLTNVDSYYDAATSCMRCASISRLESDGRAGPQRHRKDHAAKTLMGLTDR